MATSRSNFLAVVMFIFSAGGAYGQADVSEGFKEKVVGEWKRVLAGIRGARWESKIEYYSSDDPDPAVPHRVDVHRRAVSRAGWSSYLDVEEVGSKRKTKRWDLLRIANSQYYAELKQSKKRDGWALTRVTKGEKDPLLHRILEVPCPWMLVGNLQLDLLMQEDSFVFTKVEPSPAHHGKSILRAHFTYEAVKMGLAYFVKSGYIDFDSAQSYRPVGCQCKEKLEDAEGVVKGVMEYEELKGLPILKARKTEFERRRATGLSNSKEITFISNFQYNGAIADEEFRTSFYGIPEPSGVVWPRPTPWYLWFIAIAFISLGVGWFLRRRLQQAKKMGQPSDLLKPRSQP